MPTPLEVLVKVRQVRLAQRPAQTETPSGLGVTALGVPPHLAKGQKVLVPDLGEEGEVIAYGRAHTVTPPAGGRGA